MSLQQQFYGFVFGRVFIHSYCEKPRHNPVIMWEKGPSLTGKTNFVYLRKIVTG